MTLSVQKERFRHLVSGAILELWKKETGSLASVFIEATVCITSCNSRVTVIHLSDHFPGLIPEPPPPPAIAEATIPLRNNGRICHVVGQKRKMNDDDDDDDRLENNADIQTASVDKVVGYGGVRIDPSSSSSSSSSSIGRSQQHRLLMDSNNNQTFVAENAGINADNGEEDDKDSRDSEASEDGEEGDHPWRSPLPLPLHHPLGDPAARIFHRMIPENKNKNKTPVKIKIAAEDSAIHDMTGASIDKDSSKDIESYIPSQVRRRSHLDVDLFLSAPQNYTDQVREAIRSRLLNGKAGGGSTPPDSHSTPKSCPCGPFDAMAWSPIKRENPGGGGGSVIPRHGFPPPSPSPLQLLQLPRSLTGTAVSGTPHPIVPHPSSLERIVEIRDAGGASGFESKVFPSGAADPDEKGDGFFGLCGQFPGQKIERCDGNSEDKSSGSDQKTYSCGFCQKTFLFKSKYHEHLPVHTSARPFECHMCTRTYKYKYDLRVHLRTHLGIPTKSTICPFCSEKFATNKLLRSHMRETHGEPRRIVVGEEQGTATALESVQSLAPNASSV